MSRMSFFCEQNSELCQHLERRQKLEDCGIETTHQKSFCSTHQKPVIAMVVVHYFGADFRALEPDGNAFGLAAAAAAAPGAEM